MGRKKIPMKLIENNSSRRITFSKRRVGLFKKASELVSLCAVQMAIAIYSPTGTLYSFGSPSVDQIFQHFSSKKENSNGVPIDAQHATRVQNLNQQLDHLQDQLENQRKRKLVLRQQIKNSEFEKNIQQIDELSPTEVSEMYASLQDMYNKVKEQIKKKETSPVPPIK